MIIKRIVSALAAIMIFAGSGYAVADFSQDRLARSLYGVRNQVILSGKSVSGMHNAELSIMLEKWALRLNRAPENARIERTSGTIIPGRDGRYLDVEATLEQLRTAQKGERLEPVYIPWRHQWTADDIRQIEHVAGSYQTFASGSPGRLYNIQKAMGHINNILLYPGDTFSFLDNMPEFTADEGWKPAPVIIGGAFSQGLGGGVCQASSTLYNAARRANLEILERHPHSRPVRYVPPGCDAAIADPYLDLRFRNNTDGPIIVKAAAYGGTVVAAIHTKPPSSLKK